MGSVCHTSEDSRRSLTLTTMQATSFPPPERGRLLITQFEILSHFTPNPEYPGLVSRESMTKSPHRPVLHPHSLALALADPHFLHLPPTVSTVSRTWANPRANFPPSSFPISRRTPTVRPILSPVAQPSELSTVDKKELQQWCLHLLSKFKTPAEPSMS